MSKIHAAFDIDAFLIAFEGREHILEAYLQSLPSSMVSLKFQLASWEQLRDHIHVCPGDEQRGILSGFQEAFELCSDEGHERLLQACRMAGKVQPEFLELPSECLALRVLVEDRSVFEGALSLAEMTVSDALELFKPEKPVALVANLSAAVGHFRAKMAALCGSKYGSPRILLKHFLDGDKLTIGFFFEKPPKTHRVLDGTDASPSLKRDEFRPVQMDFVIFDLATGILSIKSSWGRNTDEIRTAFGEAFLSNGKAYFWNGARQILELSSLFDVDDNTIDEAGAVITNVVYGAANDPLHAKHNIHADNVREVIRRDNASHKVANSDVSKTIIKMPISGSDKKRRVVLQTPNKIQFRRTSGALEILQNLHNWHAFHAPINPQAAA